MNAKLFKIFALFAVIVLVASVAEAHKKFYSQPQYQEPIGERCVCDCGKS